MEEVVTKHLSQDRLDILEEIQKLEKEGRFDVDPEKDPPTIELTLDKVDYLNKKGSSKIKTRVANKLGEHFFDEIVKNNKLIIKNVNGIENLENTQTGAILTCNHFNPFDCFTVEKVFRMTSLYKNKKLYKVIREGNYTNFPGFYGFLFRNCDTLPLSSNLKTMTAFMKAVQVILQRGDFILIYPEQSLWWNYKKPKPLKNGAFRISAKNNVPIIPIFITMEDSDIIDENGFPVQEYTVNIKEPIYPDANLSEKENTQIMKEKNSQVWKEIYEDFYKVPLEYTTNKEEE
jgi:1-acyl-sn-glycerol-3-phosphate acyltransferase